MGAAACHADVDSCAPDGEQAEKGTRSQTLSSASCVVASEPTCAFDCDVDGAPENDSPEPESTAPSAVPCLSRAPTKSLHADAELIRSVNDLAGFGDCAQRKWARHSWRSCGQPPWRRMASMRLSEVHLPAAPCLLALCPVSYDGGFAGDVDVVRLGHLTHACAVPGELCAISRRNLFRYLVIAAESCSSAVTNAFMMWYAYIRQMLYFVPGAFTELEATSQSQRSSASCGLSLSCLGCGERPSLPRETLASETRMGGSRCLALVASSHPVHAGCSAPSGRQNCAAWFWLWKSPRS